jgi:hypothetical protein
MAPGSAAVVIIVARVRVLLPGSVLTAIVVWECLRRRLASGNAGTLECAAVAVRSAGERECCGGDRGC